MKINARSFGVLIISLLLAPLSYAAFPGASLLGGGGMSGASGDPKQIEADLKTILQETLTGLSALQEATGNKEAAAAALKTAEDLKSGKIGVSDATTIVSEQGPAVKAEMEKQQKEGKKLSADAAKTASKAILPGIVAFPMWKKVADGVQSLDKTSLMSAASLAKAATKVPAAAKSTMELYQAGISYLSFSGADTKELSKAAESGMKF